MHLSSGLSAGLAGLACLVPLLGGATAQARDLGVDVSHFQGESGIAQARWNQLASEGRTFAYIKATEGLTGPDDAAMATNVARATTAGILNGVYHYAHAENRPTTAGAILEADHFLTYAGAAIGPGKLRPVLDLEGSTSNLGTTELTDWVIAFIDRIVAIRGPAAEPIIYTTSFFTTSQLDSRMSNYDLWIRSNFGDPQTGTPTGLGVFSDWLLWQYNVASAGGISPIDLDVLHNEVASLQSLVIPEPASIAMLLCSLTLLSRRPRGSARAAHFAQTAAAASTARNMFQNFPKANAYKSVRCMWLSEMVVRRTNRNECFRMLAPVSKRRPRNEANSRPTAGPARGKANAPTSSVGAVDVPTRIRGASCRTNPISPQLLAGPRVTGACEVVAPQRRCPIHLAPDQARWVQNEANFRPTRGRAAGNANVPKSFVRAVDDCV